MSNPAKDPWQNFMLGHYYQILRTLVGVSCGMTGARYLRAERLLRRFRRAKELELKAFVLDSLRERWLLQRDSGQSLEQVLEASLAELRAPPARDAKDEPSMANAGSGRRPSLAAALSPAQRPARS